MLTSIPHVRNEWLPDREANLIDLAASLSGHPPDEIRAVARQLVGIPAGGMHERPFASRLNNDDSPLQCCITASADERGYRLIGDPGSTLAGARERHTHSLAMLESFLLAQASPDLTPLVAATLRANLPDDIGNDSSFSRGTIWLGVPLGAKGIALYLKGSWGSAPSQWERVRRWLMTLTTPDEQLTDALRRLDQHCSVASVGLEGVSRAASRLKIYFRLRTAATLADLGVDLLQSDAISCFLRDSLGEYAIPSSGLVISIGVDPTTGAICDAKIDLCGHCLARGVGDWTDFLESSAQAVGLPPLDANRFELGRRAEVAFLGFGVKRDRSPRLNIYLKGHTGT